ncbi:YceI family protein [Allomuricauda ruestringensis DSM 13258]|uniref:YceI family protein n=1 Tax=Allomuricauda ruestringensis (strain DSM 13258 / CIP 107369 / LMG 19739 / B1) TaxID=886377 RepID=G2PJ70_ALLRU|nr:YceI family protein [Allomuricauda ruestringensis]AEM71891.1 YceI family protein [Allomuricauda ruestringensis DSM 13258]
MQYHTTHRQSLLKAAILWITFALVPLSLSAQNFKLNNGEGEVMVTGTSTLHDWEEVAEQKSGSITLDNTGELPKINSLKFTVEAESLKSGKGAMDKNTYKALETKKYKQIVFELKSVKSISPITATSDRYRVVATGNLTIAGSTNTIDLPFNLTIKEDKVLLEGKKPLKMTDYNIEPPKALLGTITTGDEIEVLFNTVWK